jgi:hypothetical protein
VSLTLHVLKWFLKSLLDAQPNPDDRMSADALCVVPAGPQLPTPSSPREMRSPEVKAVHTWPSVAPAQLSEASLRIGSNAPELFRAQGFSNSCHS